MIISKELLSEVVGMPYPCITNMRIGNNIVEYTTYELPTHKYKEINIHELAHKCKEWALNQDIVIHTFIDHNGRAFARRGSGIIPTMGGNYSGDTEPEAIFRACEWILEQKAKS